MKMLNDEGRFQFIKNQEVKIDTTLPKFQKLKELSEKQSVTNLKAGSAGITEEIASGWPEDEAVKVDKTIRQQIMEMTNDTLRKYLMSPDATEFNIKFKPILEAEKEANTYSIAVINSRWGGEDMAEGYPFKISDDGGFKLFKKIFKAVKDVIKSNNKAKMDKEASLNVLNFFDSIHVETGKEKEFINRIEGYFNLVRNAALMHQDAQLDELCKNIILQIYESVLYVNGFNKYVTFGEIEKMKSPGKRVVDIDYVKNFGRIIPNEIVEKKIKCDELGVFDNYCVMYYDPTGKTYKVPESVKRDPILFGLINHSDKLYYIADWVDDKCDLTLEKVAELSLIGEIEPSSNNSTNESKAAKRGNKKKKKKAN